MSDDKDKKCVWNMGTPCNGEISRKPMFDEQIKMPICEKHLYEHTVLMGLYYGGIASVEELLAMTHEEREDKAKQAGIDLANVKI